MSNGAEASIEMVDTVTDEFVEAWARLISQLSGAPAPSKEHLEWVVRHEANSVFVARSADGSIIGMTTLVTFPLATGIRSWIHDVVVEQAHRGKGVGTALTRAALDHAEALGALTVDLTTRPWREDANRLYERMGFERRETRVYRYTFNRF
jgi:ribosomal protein S18 acetylase RimI-like enzyme